MAELEINLDSDQSCFEPGDHINGRIKWQLEKDPESLTLGLFWKTQGRGTEDVGVAKEITYDSPRLFGEKSFTIECPEGPYSYSGKLISIVWGIELCGKKVKGAAHRNITIAPGKKEVVCTGPAGEPDNTASGLLVDLHKRFTGSKKRGR